jgi:hypothetical protein
MLKNPLELLKTIPSATFMSEGACRNQNLKFGCCTLCVHWRPCANRSNTSRNCSVTPAPFPRLLARRDDYASSQAILLDAVPVLIVEEELIAVEIINHQKPVADEPSLIGKPLASSSGHKRVQRKRIGH